MNGINMNEWDQLQQLWEAHDERVEAIAAQQVVSWCEEPEKVRVVPMHLWRYVAAAAVVLLLAGVILRIQKAGDGQPLVAENTPSSQVSPANTSAPSQSNTADLSSETLPANTNDASSAVRSHSDAAGASIMPASDDSYITLEELLPPDMPTDPLVAMDELAPAQDSTLEQPSAEQQQTPSVTAPVDDGTGIAIVEMKDSSLFEHKTEHYKTKPQLDDGLSDSPWWTVDRNHIYRQENSWSSPETNRRLRFTMGYRLSVVGSDGGPFACTLDNGTDADISYDRPSVSRMLRLGATYRVWQQDKMRLDVGLTVANFSQGGEVRVTYAEGAVASSQYPYSTNYRESMHALYVEAPVMWRWRPRGIDYCGWQVSLAPACRVHTFIIDTPNQAVAWKLTLGAGIMLPNSWIRSISITTNLLPTYSGLGLHEFGIMIEH